MVQLSLIHLLMRVLNILLFFRYESSDSSESETEKSTKRDLQERDAFVERLKKKDKEKTRNVVEAQGMPLSKRSLFLLLFCAHTHSIIF